MTWHKPVDVADDPAGTGNEHDHPQVAFLPDGRAVVVWRDRRCCGGKYTDDYQIFARVLALNADGGVTAGRTIQVTDRPQAPNPSSSTNEYIGVSAGPEGLNVAWDQVVNGNPQSVYRRLPLADFPAPTPAGPGSPGPGAAPPAAPSAPNSPAPSPSRPAMRRCRRIVTLALPKLGEHPDIDGDHDDHWRVVDAALIIGKSERAIFPRHGRLPGAKTVVVTGRGRILARMIVELRRRHRTRNASRTYRVRACSHPA